MSSLNQDQSGPETMIQHGAMNRLGISVEAAAMVTLYSPREDVLFDLDVPAGEHDVLLGPLLCPPRLRYRAGIVEWRGYRLRVLENGGRTQWYSQTGANAPTFWKFREPTKRPTVSRWIPVELDWQRFHLETAFATTMRIRLSEAALLRDWINTRLIIENDSSVELSFRVLVRNAEGEVQYRSDEIPAVYPGESRAHDFGAGRLPEGIYVLSTEIFFEGQVYLDGPELTFHKVKGESECCLNPFTQHFLPIRVGADEICLEVEGINQTLAKAQDVDADPLTRIKRWEQKQGTSTSQVTLEYPSALFLETGGCGCGLSLNGSEPQIVLPGERCCVGILPAGDVTLGFHSLFSVQNEPCVVGGVIFVPLREMPEDLQGHPGLPVTGINDWSQYFSEGSLPRFSQLGRVIQGQRELGLVEVAWSIGRSWVEYWSGLPETSRWPVVPLESASQHDHRAYNYVAHTAVLEQGCPLRIAVKHAREQGLLFTAWMGLNSHYYPEAIGGIFCSKWFQDHPRFHQWRKSAKKPFPGEVSFYFSEVRKERIAILNEVAGLGVDRFLLDATRQPRVVLYHPEMTSEYRELSGVDPTTIDASHGEAYSRWIQWRSGFFTQFLRDVRYELAGQHPERKIHLSMRIPQCDFLMNLASGFDVKTWFQEKLVDRLYLNPLEIYGGGLREVTPYVDAGKASGVEIYGAIGQTWLWGGGGGVTAALMRASSLIEAGVDGLEFYESELFSRSHPLHELVPHLGSQKLITDLLDRSNLQACHPFDNESAMLGYDNHSRWDGKGWRREGFEGNCL